MFLTGPIWGVWILKGNLAASSLFETVPLTDPLVALEALAAGHLVSAQALMGVAVVLVAYLLIGGRVYCSWVCPVNPVADGAAWCRERLAMKNPRALPRSSRYWLLGGVLFVSLGTGTIAWEWVNPVTIMHRELVFGFGLGWIVVVGVFLLDTFVSRRGWCGHLCPVGAFYGLLGVVALWRVSASGRARCTDCSDCFAVCPEPHVIAPALKGSESPVVRSPHCVNCGRCIDICPENVFRFTHRFNSRTEG